MFACVSVCACAYALSMAHTDLCMSVCLSSFNEAPQIRLIEPLVHHWTSHSSDAGQCAPPPRATELTNAAYQMVETDALSSARSGTKDKKWWPLIPNRLESGVYVLFCLCQSDLEPPVDLGCSGYVSSFVRVCYVCVSKVERCGVSKEFSVSEVSESRLFDSTPLRLGEFPLQFPSAEPMLGKESRARKIYVDVSNENTTIPPPRLTIFVKQRSVRSFSLPPFSSFSLNISILADVRFWKLKFMLARGFTLHMVCCLCRDFGNTALYWSPQGLGKFGGVFKGVIHTYFLP